MSEVNEILILKIYLKCSNPVLTAFSNLSWKHSGGEIVEFDADYIAPEVFDKLKEKYPDLEFLRLDLMNVKDMVAVSVIANEKFTDYK